MLPRPGLAAAIFTCTYSWPLQLHCPLKQGEAQMQATSKSNGSSRGGKKGFLLTVREQTGELRNSKQSAIWKLGLSGAVGLGSNPEAPWCFSASERTWVLRYYPLLAVWQLNGRQTWSFVFQNKGIVLRAHSPMGIGNTSRDLSLEWTPCQYLTLDIKLLYNHPGMHAPLPFSEAETTEGIV